MIRIEVSSISSSQSRHGRVTNRVEVEINGQQTSALIDTGAKSSMMSEQFFWKCDVKLHMMNENKMWKTA